MVSLPRWTNNDSTQLWDHYNSLAAGVEAAVGLVAPRRLGKPDTQSVPHSDYTQIVGWSTQNPGDPGNVAGGIAYSNGVFTVPAGIYAIGLGTYWATSSVGDRLMRFLHNGVGLETTFTPLRGGGNWWFKECADNDTLAIDVRQTSGAALDFGGSNFFAWYQCVQIGKR